MSDMEEFVKMIDDIQIALDIAKASLRNHDTNNAMYNIDHADIDLNFLRVKLLNIKYGGTE